MQRTHLEELTARVAGGGLRRIVVGFDASESATGALDFAAAMATHSNGELIVVLCDTTHALADVSLDAALTDATNADGLAAVVQTDLAGRFDGSGPTWRFERREQSAADGLADVAREADADVIVLGRSGARFPRSALGSVAAHLTRHADRPVLIVP